MKRLLLSVIAVPALALTLSGSAFADQVKVGVLNLHQVLTTAPQVKTIESQLKAQFKPREEQLVQEQKTLAAAAQKLTKDGAGMKPEARKQEEDKIAAQQKEFQGNQMKFQTDVIAAQEAAMKKFLTNVDGIVKTVAGQQKLDLVVLSQAIAYENKESKVEQTNITDAVLKSLKSEAPAAANTANDKGIAATAEQKASEKSHS